MQTATPQPGEREEVEIQAITGRHVLSQQVFFRRDACGLTQEQLAQAAEMTQPHVALIEAGRANPTLSTMAKLAVALQCSVADLLHTDEDGVSAEQLGAAVEALNEAHVRGTIKAAESAHEQIATLTRELAKLNNVRLQRDGARSALVDEIRRSARLTRELVEARAEVERLRELNDKYIWQVRDTCTRAESAEAEVGRLEAALVAYGEHDDDCATISVTLDEAITPDGTLTLPDCTCGYSAALAPAQEVGS